MWKTIVACLVAAAVLLAFTPPPETPPETKPLDGEQIFVKDLSCSECHSMKARKIKRVGEPDPEAEFPPPDLSEWHAKKNLKAKTVVKYLMKKKKLNERKHPKKFKKAKKAELEAVVDWMLTKPAEKKK